MLKSVRRACQVLLAVMAGPAWAGDHKVELQLANWLSNGLPSKSYWQGQPMVKDQPVQAYLDWSLTLQTALAGFPVFLELREQATLNTNQASLVLASQKNVDLEQLSPGTTALQGTVQSAFYQALGTQFEHAWDTRGRIVFRPKLLLIRQYMLYKANGQISQAGSEMAFTADLFRQSSHSLDLPGMQDQGVAGYGLSSDLRLEWKEPSWDAQFSHENIFSWIRPATTNASERSYRVRTTASRLEPGREPSMAGAFGSGPFSVGLPKIGRAAIAIGPAGTRFVLGAKLIDRSAIGFWGGRMTLQDHEFTLAKNQGGNVDVAWKKASSHQGAWSLSLGLIVSPHGKSSIGQMTLASHF